MSAELMTRDAADALRELEEREGRIRAGLSDIARDLAEIKHKRLFEAAGYTSWTAYVEQRLRLDHGTASRLVSALPILDALPVEISTGTTIRAVHLRKLENMQPARAAKVLARAIERAPVDRDGRPRLTAKLVEAEARAVGWKPSAEYIAEQRAAEGAPAPKPRRTHDYDKLRRACETILALPSAGELSGRYEWTHADREMFENARLKLADLLE